MVKGFNYDCVKNEVKNLVKNLSKRDQLINNNNKIFNQSSKYISRT